MKRPTPLSAILRITGLATAVLALGACEFRRDDDAAVPAETATPGPGTAIEPSPSPSTISIIRDDLVEEPAPLETAPSEPLELILPFSDGADLSAEVERMLQGVLESDANLEGWPVVLGGHTDSSGNDQANLRASRSRAETVAAWLVEHGVADGRIEVIAFGEQNPLAPNARPDGSPDEQARRRNRRVELRIAPPQARTNAAETRSYADEDA